MQNRGLLSVIDRQKKIPGFDQSIYSSSRFLSGGAGGLISELAEGVARKGARSIYLCDPDVVDITNLNRQRFFEEDIDENKAISLAKNLVKECTCGTELVGYPYSIQKMIEDEIVPDFDVGMAGFDNEPSRYDFSELLLEKKKPGIFMGVNETADAGYLFVQEIGGPCYSCAFPPHKGSKRMECPGVAAVKDILKLLGGIGLYALDTLLMNRERYWNLWVVSLSGRRPDAKMTIRKRSNCGLCSSKRRENGDKQFAS